MGLSQEEYKDLVLEQVLNIDKIVRDFSELHHLTDTLMQREQSYGQNSFLFQVNLSLLVSSMVHMKNTLVKFMDHESKEKDPLVNIGTQQI